MSNRVPGAQSTVIPTVGLITGGISVRKPVILGVGDIKVLVENERLVRGDVAGGKDVLANTLYDSSSIVTIGNSPSSTDWVQTTNWLADTVTNSVDWSPNVGGVNKQAASTTLAIGTITTGDTSAPYTVVFADPASNTSLSTVTGYYTGATFTITNTDSSNYGLVHTVTSHVSGVTGEFNFASDAFTYPVNIGDTFIVSVIADEPPASQEYYVTYYKKLDNFTLTEYSSESDIKAAHGDIELSSSTESVVAPNMVTIGALLALRNGAQSVIVGQLDYTSWGTRLAPSESEFNVSLNIQIESLKEITDYKLYVVPMTSKTSSINNVWNHCKILSAPENKAERTCIAGVPRGTSVAGIKALATAYKSVRMILPAPGSARFTDLSTFDFDGDILAAAYAGRRCNTARVSSTVMGETLAGITIDTIYTYTQMRDLLGAGVAVLESRAGLVNIVHDKSTNPATADTEENSSVEVADYLKRITRDTLWDIYKGAPIDTALPHSMASTLASIFESEIKAGNISEYDPTSITVLQDVTEPRKMLVNGKVKIIYNAIWIDIVLQQYV